MLKRIVGWFNEADPGAEEMTALLVETDAILKSLDAKVEPHSLQGEALKDLKKTYETARKDVPMDTQGVDKAEWAKRPREERAGHYADILPLKQALMGLDYPDIRAGFVTFVLLAVTLVLSVVVYLSAHMADYTSSGASASAERPASAMHAAAQTPKPDTPASTPTKPQQASTAPAAGNPPGADRTVEIHEQLAILRLQLNKPSSTDIDWSGVSATAGNLSESLLKDTLSFRSKKLLGTFNAAVKQQDAETGKQTLSELEIAVAQDLEDPPANYLWTSGPGKWLEFAFWAFFGVLVGLMYYVSTRLKVGLFDRQDCSTMAAEVLMAPIVACVVFFLLSETGITEISTAGESIFTILGFAFLLGYAIRRTVGVLDNLKKRILPEP